LAASRQRGEAVAEANGVVQGKWVIHFTARHARDLCNRSRLWAVCPWSVRGRLNDGGRSGTFVFDSRSVDGPGVGRCGYPVAQMAATATRSGDGRSARSTPNSNTAKPSPKDCPRTWNPSPNRATPANSATKTKKQSSGHDPSAATDTVSRKTTWGHRRGAPPGGVPQGAGCRSLSRWEASRSSSSGIAPEGTPSRSVRHCRTTAVMTGSGCTASNM